MGRGREEPDLKSQLVIEICNVSRRAIACSHWHGGANPTRSPFIDWYLVLRVEENAGLDLIRKQYRKLALQLHPDKNKHPKAEIAFKLVSEAHGCLSDNERRAEFNLERQNSYCSECNRICNVPGTHAAKTRALCPTERLRSQKIMRGIKDLRARFAEEVRVVENCLRAFTASTKESPVFNPKKEHPIFNPSDYLFQGYPHRRTGIHKEPDSFQHLWADNVPNSEQRKCDSTTVEVRSRSGVIKFKPSCFG